MSKLSQLIIVDDKIKNKVRSSYNKTYSDIEKDVFYLREWLKKQSHLPKNMDDDDLERMLMRNKFRVEQTKKKLDAYYTLRGIYSEFFYPENFDPKSEVIAECLRTIYSFPLPRPLPDGIRLFFYKIIDPDMKHYDIQKHFSYYFGMLELMNQSDYCLSIRSIWDLSEIKLAHYTKLDPLALLKAMKLWQKGYSSRFAGIEIINAPSFIELVLKLLNGVIKVSKIRVHQSLDSLYEVVPIEYLPDEYGGKAGKLQYLQDAWAEEIQNNREFLKERASAISNETLRIGDSPYDSEMFGAHGSFKKLNLD